MRRELFYQSLTNMGDRHVAHFVEQPSPAGEGAQPVTTCYLCGAAVVVIPHNCTALPPERAALVGEIVSLLPYYDLSLLKGEPMLNGTPMAADYQRLWETTHRVLREAAAALRGETGSVRKG